MRCLLVFMIALLAAPLSVSAQITEKGTSLESDKAPEALQSRSTRWPYTFLPRTSPKSEDSVPAEPKRVPLQGMRRWHPDAYVNPEGETVTEFRVEYVVPEPTPETKRRTKRIAIGVSVTLAAVLGIAVGTGVALSSLKQLGE